nr:Chain A, ASP-LEU-PHE-VAL-PRO-PRO-ILE-ASP [Senecio pinnatifolius]
DLFVPPID